MRNDDVLTDAQRWAIELTRAEKLERELSDAKFAAIRRRENYDSDIAGYKSDLRKAQSRLDVAESALRSAKAENTEARIAAGRTIQDSSRVSDQIIRELRELISIYVDQILGCHSNLDRGSCVECSGNAALGDSCEGCYGTGSDWL